MKRAAFCGTNNKRQLQSSITQTGDDLLAGPIVQFHVNFRHCLLKRAQRRRHDLCPKYRRIANVQFRFTGLRKRTHVSHSFICSFQYCSSFFEKGVSCVSQPDRFACAFEQLHAQLVFKVADLSAHGRLRDVKFLSRGAQDVLRLCHGHEVTKMP
ncbi:MAG: hypothetical protein Udaeo2_34090 [Candidatus Udaeobacter sp.]|nr:MAG: hypothetical protein Udaeo2_34090 [Candidatus Udaeobacter sp.]